MAGSRGAAGETQQRSAVSGGVVNNNMRILGMVPTHIELPICQALSARVKVAIRQLERGDIAGAMEVLKQCDRVLPLTTRQNMRAAEDVLNRVQQ
jgi:hypothetical protein